MEKDGFLDGSTMATVFNMLRANDLIWPFFINNYLLGKEPTAFDLLYWNSDSTRIPAKAHSYYLRTCYLHNLLREPGGIELNGTPIDLRKIKDPDLFYLYTRGPHYPVEIDLRRCTIDVWPYTFRLGWFRTYCWHY